MDATVYCMLHENGNRSTVQGVKVTCGGILMRLHFQNANSRRKHVAAISCSDILRILYIIKWLALLFFSRCAITESVLCSIKRIGSNRLLTFVVNG